MDFELEQNIILCYESVGQASACQEETQEAIVPDACPDILRIVEVCAQAFPTRCEAGEGQATVVGMIQANVLYMPETGTLLQTIPLRLPFSLRIDVPGATTGAISEMSARICHADARILNPRKLLLRCELLAEVNILCRREHTLCSAVLHPEQGHICQRQESVEYERLSAVPQRIFPISEEIRLSGNQPPTLLWARASAQCSESRIIGTKLIFKGTTDVELLLQTPEGDMERRMESFPFSQILDAKGVGENGTCQLRLALNEFSCVQPLDDPFHLMLEGEILAMGQVRETEQFSLLTDLYSTTHHCLPEKQELRLYTPCQQTVIPQTFRDLLESETVVRSVCSCRFQPGHILCTPEKDAMVATAHGLISVLYLDEERRPRTIEKHIELSARTSIPVGSEVCGLTLDPGELYAAPCAGGIDFRLGVEFSMHTACPVSAEVIHRAALGEARSTDCTRPSVILRLPEAGETLWDIAKVCGTTCEEIMQANELADEALPEGKMLLIPSSR